MRFDRRLITHFEWLLPLLALGVSGLGAMTVYSATHVPGMHGLSPLALRQLLWLAGGSVAMLAALIFDYRRLERSAFVVYVLVLLAVLAVPVLGRIGGGSRRWIPLGPVSIQPSEFMKLGLVLVLARHFARSYERGLGLGAAVVPMLLTAVPAAAILAQPDLGTVAVLGIVSLTMLMLGGIRLRWFVLLGVAVAVAAPVAWPHLKVYQQKRILTFVHPEMDPRGAGYHVLQSKIAVGSGMTWGKGFLHGTQNQLNFLPEQHTDFIFSVFAEEWGFVGALVLLALYLALVLRGIVIASRARDRFGVLLVLGLTAIVFWQAVINVGMTTGLLPVVGIPLPFFSYGGSSLLCLLIGIGLTMNVSMRRYYF
ncbi:MAG: rod shape-determining protein RodA [Deltaproteobacteria bacterium]|nr:MAG: rod shape-determining protein RodA [Deltaproteobacteria bacterium]